jgi:hypothetical protein
MNDAAPEPDGNRNAPRPADAAALLQAADTAARDMLSTIAGRGDKDVVKLDVRSFRTIALLLRRLAAGQRQREADGAGAYVRRCDLPDSAKMRNVAEVTGPLGAHLARYAQSADIGGVRIQGDTLRLVAGLLDELTSVIEGYADGIEKLQRDMFENDRPII